MNWFDVILFVIGFGCGAGVINALREGKEKEKKLIKDFPQILEAPAFDPGVDRTGALAVPDTTEWWIAIHQILDMASRETVETARRWSNEPYKCMAAVNAGDGINFVRIKLNEARNAAIQSGKQQPTPEGYGAPRESRNG